jgi:signal transduction histidine kinase
MLGRMPPRPGERHDEEVALGLVVVSVFGAALIAAGPVLGRMRRLAEAVRQSAAAEYGRPVSVDGSQRDEVADLARAFDAAGASARDHLVEARRRRDALREFVANTTHDVALPLTVLQGHLSALGARAADPDSRTRLREAMQEAQYMSSLLRNLGVAATLDDEPGMRERTPVDIGAMVERVAARHRAPADTRDVSLEFAVPESPVIAAGDVTLLEQALSNLVDNAVKYNRPGGHVAVVLDRRGDRFELAVKDDGPGVAADELPALTARRFRGADARTRPAGGQGLGLAIAAEAVAALDMQLRLESPATGGLTATITGECVGPARLGTDRQDAI